MQASKRSRGRAPRWAWLVLGVCVAAPLVLLTLVLTRRTVAWLAGEFHSVTGSLGWLVTGTLLIACVVAVVQALRSRDAGSQTPARRRAAPFVVIGLLALSGGTQMALALAGGRLDRHWETRRQDGVDIYKNHDLSRLVGQCVRLAMLRHREAMSDETARRDIERIARHAPEVWSRLTDEGDARVLALADAELVRFIRAPSTGALHQDEWAGIIAESEHAGGVDLGSEVRGELAGALSADFGVTLRESLKSDFVRGGKAWASMQLDIAGALLDRERRHADERDPAVADALRGVTEALARHTRGGETIESLLRATLRADDDNARRVASRFERLESYLSDQFGEVAASQATLIEIERTKADPLLTDDEKRERILALADDRLASVEKRRTPLDLPEDLRSYIRTLTANASLLDQHRASVLLDEFDRADDLAEQYEAQRASQREAEDFVWFVTRGDRFLQDQRFEEAHIWFGRAIRLNDNDPRVLTKAAASVLWSAAGSGYQENMAKAESWLTRALELDLARHGELHPYVASDKNNLAYALTLLQRNDQAGEILREALNTLERIHGTDAVRVDIAQARANLAWMLQAEQDHSGAQELLRSALGIFRSTHPDEPDHPDIASTLSSLGAVLASDGKNEEARDLLEDAVSKFETGGGAQTSPQSFARCLDTLGVVLKRLQQPQESYKNHQKALELSRSLHGQNAQHPDIARSLFDIGVLLATYGNREQAEGYYEESTSIYRTIHGRSSTNPEYMMALESLAKTRRLGGKFGPAAESYAELVAAQQAAGPDGPGDEKSAVSHLYLADCLRQVERLAEAEPHAERALELFLRVYRNPPQHRNLVMASASLAMIRTGLGDHRGALRLTRDALAMAERCIDPEDVIHASLGTLETHLEAQIGPDTPAADE